MSLVGLNNPLEILNKENKGNNNIDEQAFDNCNKYYISSFFYDNNSNIFKILGNVIIIFYNMKSKKKLFFQI